MKNVLIVLLLLNLVTGYIYHVMVIDQLQSDLFLEYKLTQACELQIDWLEMQLNEVSL